jgi:hypothetical protein
MFFDFLLIEITSCVISYHIITVTTSSSLTSGCQDLASLPEMDYNGLVLDLACMQDVPGFCSYEIVCYFN